MTTVSSDIERRAETGFRITGRHVLIALLAFFGIVVGVNLVFVHLALDSWTGLTDRDSYRTGLSWNRTLERSAAQKSLGWTVDVASRTERTAQAGELRLEVTLTLSDRAGRPLTGLALSGEARHPVLETNDRAIAFVETGGGRYVGTAVLPGAADWGLKLVATRPDGPDYRIDTLATVR